MNLDLPVRWWHCPSCGLRDRTQQAGVHTQFHACPAIGGVNLPMCEATGPDVAADARHTLVMRDDYIGNSNIGLVAPVAAVRTERGDGSNDVTVFAPTATAGVAGVNV
jgi:hypothetical protein